MTYQQMLPTILSEDMTGQEYFVWFNDSLFYAQVCKSIGGNSVVLAGRPGIDTIAIFGYTGVELKIVDIDGQYAYKFEHGSIYLKEGDVSQYVNFYPYYNKFAPERD